MVAPPLAVESHQLPFLIAAGLFAIVAVAVSVMGLRSDRFSTSPGGPKAGMVLAGVFTVAAMTTAVLTAERPSKADVEPLKTTASQGEEPASSAPEEPQTESETAPAPKEAATGPVVKLAADPDGQLEFDTDTLRAKGGSVSVDFTNAAPTPHNVVIERDGKEVGKTDTITASKAKLTVQLKPGSYTYFCSVPGHEQAGMKGEL